MKDSAIVRRRLAAQQISHARLRSPAELVRWMGAVQAQDYYGSLWALGLRLPSALEEDIEQAVAARTIVRTWPMRGTLHFVQAEDVRWMLELLGPRVIARSAGRYRELSLDAACFRRSERLLVRALQGRGPLTRHETYAALRRGGVSPEGQRGIHILGHLAQRGSICLGPRQERQPTFVLLDEWVAPARAPTREEALGLLAERYFASHGPATLQDFAWWSGLLLKDAQQGVAAAGSGLVKDALGDTTLWASAASHAPARKRSAPSAALLPPWDEYVVAYRNRDAAVGHLDAHGLERLKTVGSSLIVIDGRVRGSWKRTLAKSRVRVTPDFWTTVGPADRAAVRKAALRYARFLGLELDP